MSKYRVWQFRIMIPLDAETPIAFDGPPRSAAVDAVEAAGIPVIACFSGWGHSETESELAVIENRLPSHDGDAPK